MNYIFSCFIQFCTYFPVLFSFKVSRTVSERIYWEDVLPFGSLKKWSHGELSKELKTTQSTSVGNRSRLYVASMDL